MWLTTFCFTPQLFRRCRCCSARGIFFYSGNFVVVEAVPDWIRRQWRDYMWKPIFTHVKYLWGFIGRRQYISEFMNTGSKNRVNDGIGSKLSWICRDSFISLAADDDTWS